MSEIKTHITLNIQLSAILIVLALIADVRVYASTITKGTTGTATVNAGGGSVGTWGAGNLGNGAANDNSYVTFANASTKNKNTNTMLFKGFDFTNLPGNISIDGITLTIHRYGTSGVGTIQDNTIQLLDATGAQVGDNKALTTTNWPASEEIQSYGGATDNWGGVLTVADIKDPNFGVAIIAKLTSGNSTSFNLYIDYVELTIDYSIAFTAQTGNWYDGTAWGTNPCTCIEGVDYPGASQTVDIPGGVTVTIESGYTANALNVNLNSDQSTSLTSTLVLGDNTSVLNVSGSLNLTTTTSASVDFISGSISMNGGTINITDDLILTADKNGGNITSNNVGIDGGLLSVGRDVIMSSDATSATNTIDMSTAGSELRIGNDFILGTGGSLLNGAGTSGTITYNGSSAQIINDITTYYNLTVNNTSATGVTLNQPISVNGTLTLTDGNLFTDATNILTMNAGSASTGSSADSFVDGPMEKAGTTAFVFPVGDGTRWARIGIDAPTSSTTFTAEYVATAYSDITSMAVSPTPVLYNVSAVEYWNLTRTVGTGDARVTLYWEDSDFSDITNCSTADLRVAHWNGAAWENNNNAVSVSGSCSSSSGSISTSTNVTSFSPFTFGSLGGGLNPLPIELLSFNAEYNEDVVDIDWMTATEINNDFFTVEKSTDGISFIEVANVEGAGNSNQVLTYSIVDDVPVEGITYYRLKQTDYNGEYTYSDLKAVNVRGSNQLSVFPNPSTGDYFNVRLSQHIETYLDVFVYDAMGNVVYAETIQANSAVNTIKITPTSKLEAGVYFISITQNGGVPIVERVIVN